MCLCLDRIFAYIVSGIGKTFPLVTHLSMAPLLGSNIHTTQLAGHAEYTLYTLCSHRFENILETRHRVTII
jgi:hypothetical protein